jgi:hypothetical protein
MYLQKKKKTIFGQVVGFTKDDGLRDANWKVISMLLRVDLAICARYD